LSDDPETVRRQVMRMYTDPTRLCPTDPGHVEGNPVFVYHELFNPNTEEVEELKERYRAGRVGDVEVKQRLIAALNGFLEPIRERRRFYEQRLGDVEDLLLRGTQRGREEAARTIEKVRHAMQIDYFSARRPV
jgi:tryptophanyl-tRNA synthetase